MSSSVKSASWSPISSVLLGTAVHDTLQHGRRDGYTWWWRRWTSLKEGLILSFFYISIHLHANAYCYKPVGAPICIITLRWMSQTQLACFQRWIQRRHSILYYTMVHSRRAQAVLSSCIPPWSPISTMHDSERMSSLTLLEHGQLVECSCSLTLP